MRLTFTALVVLAVAGCAGDVPDTRYQSQAEIDAAVIMRGMARAHFNLDSGYARTLPPAPESGQKLRTGPGGS